MTKQRTILQRVFPFMVFLFLAIFIEIFVFNWGTISTRKNQPIEYTNNLRYSNAITPQEDGSFYISSNRWQDVDFQLFDIHTPVNYIEFDFEVISEDPSVAALPITYRLSATDEGNAYYAVFPEKIFVHSLHKSHYTRINTSGNVSQIRISVYDLEGQSIRIHSVTVNARRPLFFSSERLAIILLILCSFYLIRPTSELWKIPFNTRSHYQKFFVFAFLCLQSLFIVVLTIISAYPESSNLPYTQLADALIHGTAHIAEVPSKELIALSNPYDTTLRTANGVSYLWDYAYYNSHYYVYFGVIPALLLHIPYQLITGQPLTSHLDIILPGILYSFGITYLLYQIIKRYFKDIPFVLFFLLTVLVCNIAPMYFLYCHPDFYSVPKIFSVAFTVWGLGLWISALDADRLRPVPLTLGSLCMAAVAGCRPQMLLGSFLSIPLFYTHLLPTKERLHSKGYWKKILCFLFPFVLIAAGLMFYNAIRFDSPFDFGANYNLTTNDMTKRGFRIGRIPAGLFGFFFQNPVYTMQFPFLSEAAEPDTLFQGINIFEPTFGGLIACNSIFTVSFLSMATRLFDKKKKLHLFCILSLLFSFMIAAADAIMAGVLESYKADFTIFLLIPTFTIICTIYEQLRNRTHRTYFHFAFILLFLQSIFYSFCFVFTSLDLSYNITRELYYKIYYFISFWL